MRNIGTRNQWYENITKPEDKCSNIAVMSQESVDLGLNLSQATILSWTICIAWWSFYTQVVLSLNPSLNPHTPSTTILILLPQKIRPLRIKYFKFQPSPPTQLQNFSSSSMDQLLSSEVRRQNVTVQFPVIWYLWFLMPSPPAALGLCFNHCLPHSLLHVQPPFFLRSLPSAGKYA